MTIKELYELAASLKIEDFELYARGNDGEFSCFYDLDFGESKKKQELITFSTKVPLSFDALHLRTKHDSPLNWLLLTTQGSFFALAQENY